MIRPVKESGGEFAEQILADLISQGLSGQDLLEKFKETSRQVRSAVDKLLEEAETIVAGKAPYDTMGDIFGAEA